MKEESAFPPGWDEGRVRRVLKHYETLSEEEAVIEDEAAFEQSENTVMEIPRELVPVVRMILAEQGA